MSAFDDDDSSGSNSFEKFDAMHKDKSTMELIQTLSRVRSEKDALEEELKGVTAEHKYLATVLIPDRFAAEGIKNMSVAGVGRISLRGDIYASIKAGKKPELFDWLRDIGSGDLIQDAVAPSTLKAFLKGRIKAGDEFPEELVNVTPYQTATITKT